jgi:UMF1 family MFS transporter
MALWVSNIVGPMTYGVMTWVSDNDHRFAMLVTGMYFVIGLVLLLPMNLKKELR